MRNNSMTQGPILRTLLAFSLPIIVTNTVSMLFHSADVAVLALLADGTAVAAVGACGSLISLLVSIFTGLATGANVLISKRIGAGDGDGTRRAVGTSLIVGLLSGVFLMVFALIFAKQLLILMQCQPDVLELATLYMRIYFLGMPVLMLNSFVASILRAAGDSVRPMVYTVLSGAINIFANVLLVAACGMTVEGVAIATVLSSALTLSLGLIRLLRSKGICRVEKAYLRIDAESFFETVRVGVPTCICSLFFYVANLFYSAAVNGMSTEAMTANAISSQFDGIIYVVGSAIATAVSVMVAQNFGARQAERIRSILRIGVVYVTAVSLMLGGGFVLFAQPMLSWLSDSDTVIAIAKDRMTLLCLTYFVTGIMEVLAFSLRALRRQRSTMVVGGICGFGVRTLWVCLIFPLSPSLSMLFAGYAVSALAAIAIYLFVYRSAMREIFTRGSC